MSLPCILLNVILKKGKHTWWMFWIPPDFFETFRENHGARRPGKSNQSRKSRLKHILEIQAWNICSSFSLFTKRLYTVTDNSVSYWKNSIRGHKGQNSAEIQCRGFFGLGISMLWFLSSKKMPWNHNVVA